VLALAATPVLAPLGAHILTAVIARRMAPSPVNLPEKDTDTYASPEWFSSRHKYPYTLLLDAPTAPASPRNRTTSGNWSGL